MLLTSTDNMNRTGARQAAGTSASTAWAKSSRKA